MATPAKKVVSATGGAGNRNVSAPGGANEAASAVGGAGRGRGKGGRGGKGKGGARSSSPGNRENVPAKTTPPTDKNGQVVLCRFFNTEGGCLKDKECIYRHERKPKEDRSQTPGKGGKKGRGKGSGSREGSVNNSYCRLFLREDGCPYGAGCRFEHVNQQEANRRDNAKAKGKGKEGKKGKGRGKGGDEGGKAAPAVLKRKVHFEFGPDCPDNLDLPRTEYQERNRERIVLISGFGDEYYRVVMIQYCIARSAAIDLADGIGLLGPEPGSHCVCDPEEWDGV